MERSKSEDVPVLALEDLRVGYRRPGGVLWAVDGVDLIIGRGESHGLVGESGCGKSTLALALLGLAENAAVGGRLRWRGEALRLDRPGDLRGIRGAGIALALQDARGSLNPARRIGRQIMDVLRRHRKLDRVEAQTEALDLLNRVRIADPAWMMDAYPSACSGGMVQRAAVAMALACRPAVLIVDEPTSALDSPSAAAIVRLLAHVRDEFGVALLVITHDIRVVRDLCRQVHVMYKGRIVERGPTAEVLASARHPYSALLLGNASFDMAPAETMHVASISGAPDRGGCRYRVNCPRVLDLCAGEEPPLGRSSHTAACLNPLHRGQQ